LRLPPARQIAVDCGKTDDNERDQTANAPLFRAVCDFAAQRERIRSLVSDEGNRFLGSSGSRRSASVEGGYLLRRRIRCPPTASAEGK
jgi:hypothetical protein